MNINEEKVFLYGMMKDITEERRRLTDMYFSLKERIDTLIKLEEKGIGELSTKGFIDLFNDRETQLTIQNMNREVEHAIARRQEKDLAKPRYDQIAATLERGAADRAEDRGRVEEQFVEKQRLLGLEKRRAEESAAEVEKRDRIVAWENKQREQAEQEEQALIEQAIHESQQVALRLEEENAAKKSEYTPVSTHIFPKELIEQEKDKDKGKLVAKEKETKTYNSLTEVTAIIVQILKDAGRPLKSSELLKGVNKLVERPYTSKNFASNVIYRIKNKEPKIQQVTPGFYQYNTKG